MLTINGRTYADATDAIRAFLLALPASHRKAVLFMDLLRECNAGIKLPPATDKPSGEAMGGVVRV